MSSKPKRRNGIVVVVDEYTTPEYWLLFDQQETLVRALAAGLHAMSKMTQGAYLVRIPYSVEFEEAYYPEPASVRSVLAIAQGFSPAIARPSFLKKAARSVGPRTNGPATSEALAFLEGLGEDEQVVRLCGLYLQALATVEHRDSFPKLTPAQCLFFVAEHWDRGDAGFSNWLGQYIGTPLIELSLQKAAHPRKKWIQSEDSETAILGDSTYLEIQRGQTSGVSVLLKKTPGGASVVIACGPYEELLEQARDLLAAGRPSSVTPPPFPELKNPFQNDMGPTRETIEATEYSYRFAIVDEFHCHEGIPNQVERMDFDDGLDAIDRARANERAAFTISREGFNHRVMVLLNRVITFHGQLLPDPGEIPILEKILNGYLNVKRPPRGLAALIRDGQQPSAPGYPPPDEPQLKSHPRSVPERVENRWIKQFPDDRAVPLFLAVLSRRLEQLGFAGMMSPMNALALVYNYWHLGDEGFGELIQSWRKLPTLNFYDDVSENALKSQTKPISWHIKRKKRFRYEYAHLNERVQAHVVSGTRSKVAILYIHEPGNNVYPVACGNHDELRELVATLYMDRDAWVGDAWDDKKLNPERLAALMRRTA